VDGFNHTLAHKRRHLHQRARILQRIRAFFTNRDFLEVETPQRIPCNAPELHIDAVTCGDMVLHTSPELCMKRLLAAGYERIFQICHCWRAAERGSRHLPEFTMLEWYRRHSSYTTLMDDCQQLLIELADSRQLFWQGQPIDLTPPFERLTLKEAFVRYASLSLQHAMQQNCFEEVYTTEVEPNLGRTRPTFICDYPAAMAALARLQPDNPHLAERFELYIGGMELANAFGELCDATTQRQRFENEEQQRRASGKTPHPLPEPFLRELEHLSAAAGIALGIDRLVMLLCDSPSIDNVVAFTPEEL